MAKPDPASRETPACRQAGGTSGLCATISFRSNIFYQEFLKITISDY